MFVLVLLSVCISFSLLIIPKIVINFCNFSICIRRTGVLRPTCGPHQVGTAGNQRPRSKANKLYYYQGYHDSSNKHKRKPPKGMFINHDDVRKLASQDLAATNNVALLPSSQKPPASDHNCLLIETDRKIGVLWSQVRIQFLFDQFQSNCW